MIESLVAIENWAGAIAVLALAIVYKMIDEVFKKRGKENFKKNVEQYFANDCHAMKCGWTADDHKWLSEIRDCVKYLYEKEKKDK